METLKFWKKLNSIVKSKNPMESAKWMLDTGYITREETAWAITALATLPLVMLESLERNKS